MREYTLVTQTLVNMEELVKQQQIVLHVTAPLEELENSAKRLTLVCQILAKMKELASD